MTENEFKALKAKVEDQKVAADRAKGALDQLKRQLKEEFDCNSIAEAKSLLAQYEKDEKTAKEKLDRGVEDYERKWRD